MHFKEKMHYFKKKRRVSALVKIQDLFHHVCEFKRYFLKWWSSPRHHFCQIKKQTSDGELHHSLVHLKIRHLFSYSSWWTNSTGDPKNTQKVNWWTHFTCSPLHHFTFEFKKWPKRPEVCAFFPQYVWERIVVNIKTLTVCMRASRIFYIKATRNTVYP